MRAKFTIVKNLVFKLALSMVLPLTISGCAPVVRQSNSANDPELKRLGVSAASCILSSAKQLDDQISPADTIAVGVMSKCQSEINAYDTARLPSTNTAFGNAAWAARNTGWMRQITGIVLETRAAVRR
jgi:hypothetical protein